MKIYLILSALFFIAQPAQAQAQLRSLYVLTAQTDIIRHSSRFNSIGDLQTGNSVVMGMYFRNRTNQPVRQIFTGVNATYYRSGSKVIGNGWAAQGSLNFPVLGWRQFSGLCSAGLGGIFMEKHFHPVSNTANQIIGSAFNAFAALQLQAEYRFLPRWALTMNGGLTHISNGAFQLPNIGINTIQSGLGLNFTPARLPTAETIGYSARQNPNEVAQPQSRRFSNSLKVGTGSFQKKGFNGQQFWMVNAGVFQHFEALKNFTLSVGPSVEYTNYLTSLRERHPNALVKNNYRVSVETGMDWFFEHLFLKGGAGYYLYKPDLAVSKEHFYYRLAANYCFKNTADLPRKTPFLGVGLKAYKNVAQHPELTGGYLF